jgi:hypothetical protein
MVHTFEFKIKSKSLKTKVKERFFFCIFPLLWLSKSLMFISHHLKFASSSYYQNKITNLGKRHKLNLLLLPCIPNIKCCILVWTMCLMHKCVCIWQYILQNYNYKLHFQNLCIYHIARFFLGEFIFIVSTWNLFFLHILTFFVKRNGPNCQI